MPPRPLVTTTLALLGLLALPSCIALQEIAALRTVSFRFASVSDVRLVGIPIGAGSSYSTLGLADAARLGAAVASKQAPIELVAHVSAGVIDMTSDGALPNDAVAKLREEWERSGIATIVNRPQSWHYHHFQMDPQWARPVEVSPSRLPRTTPMPGGSRTAGSRSRSS